MPGSQHISQNFHGKPHFNFPRVYDLCLEMPSDSKKLFWFCSWRIFRACAYYKIAFFLDPYQNRWPDSREPFLNRLLKCPQSEMLTEFSRKAWFKPPKGIRSLLGNAKPKIVVCGFALKRSLFESAYIEFCYVLLLSLFSFFSCSFICYSNKVNHLSKMVTIICSIFKILSSGLCCITIFIIVWRSLHDTSFLL